MHCVLLGVVKMLMIYGLTSCTGTAFSASPQKFRKWTNAFLTSNHRVLSQDCQDLLLMFPIIRLRNSRTFSFIMDCLAFTEFYQQNSTTISPSLCFPHTSFYRRRYQRPTFSTVGRW